MSRHKQQSNQVVMFDFQHDTDEQISGNSSSQRSSSHWVWEWFSDHEQAYQGALDCLDALDIPHDISGECVFFSPYRNQFTFGISGWNWFHAVAFHDWVPVGTRYGSKFFWFNSVLRDLQLLDTVLE